MRHGVARRAKLYFLRERVGKAASLRERRPQGPKEGAATGSTRSTKAKSAAKEPAKAAATKSSKAGDKAAS